MTLETYALGEKRLRSLGIEVSKLRAELRTTALHQARKEALEQQQDIMEISRMARRVQRGAFRDNTEEKRRLAPDIAEGVAVGSRKRSKRRGPLTLNEKIDVIYRVLIGFEKHSELARELRVTPNVIAQVVLKAKRNEKFLKEMLMKQDETIARRAMIKQTVEGLNARREIIDNTA